MARKYQSNIFIRSTLCFSFLCSTTLSHRHVASEDSRRQESKPDEEQFQLLFLRLPCAVSVPSAFPVPFPVPFHGLCAPASDFAMWLTFLLKEIAYLFVSTKLTRNTFLLAGPRESAKGTGKDTGKGTGKALERDWEQTQHMATVRTVAGTARHHLKTTHACEVSGRRPHPVP